MSTSACGGHAGRLSVWWMWCYRSTKDLCCPIQQGIQAGISSLRRGLWCICVSRCLISANRKGLNGWPQLTADSSIVWGPFSRAGFVCCISGSASPPSRLIDFWATQRCHLSFTSLKLVYLMFLAVQQSWCIIMMYYEKVSFCTRLIAISLTWVLLPNF